jgi:hypothetical protein
MGVKFAMLFTFQESRRTSDPALSRDRNYSFTLDALTLKPSGFCNVGVFLDGLTDSFETYSCRLIA